MQFIEREHPFRIRPIFIATSLVGVAVLITPHLVAQSYLLKRAVLFLASLSTIAGWFFMLRETGKFTLRQLPELIAAIYLLISLPVFLFEISQVRWLALHPWHNWFSMYVRPWVHWGYFLILVSVICSLLGRGKARVAFVAGSLLLMVLRFATGSWVY